MPNYQSVIGLEVHIELNTKTKMFCRCSADYFGKEPNSLTCPICLGLPGAIPYINEDAIKKCIQIGLSLNCSINPASFFERKNYFYPDLPKGYQISQYVLPIAKNGWIEVEDPSAGSGQVRKIRINRAHQEEDTGKLTYVGNETLIDFNRSGIPLVEIVTEPDFTDSSQVKDYAKKLQQIFRYLGVSNADMERGDMRLEANVSVRKLNGHPKGGSVELPDYRVELKNINSFRFMVAAVEYEINRQIEALEKDGKLTQETRGWNEEKRQTYLQRSKEEAHDYRYFSEPDLPELQIAESRVKNLESSMPELPRAKVKRWEKDYGIKSSDARVLTEDKALANFFEQVTEYGKDKNVSPQAIANYLVNRKIDLVNTSFRQVVDDLAALSTGIISDTNALTDLAKQAIKENPQAVEDYRKGKESALQVLIGAVMKKTSGKADASRVKEVLKKLIKP